MLNIWQRCQRKECMRFFGELQKQSKCWVTFNRDVWENCVWGFLEDFTGGGGNNWPGKKQRLVKCRSHAVTLHISDIKKRHQKTPDIKWHYTYQTSQKDFKRLQTSNDFKWHYNYPTSKDMKIYQKSKDIKHQQISNI